MTSCQVAEAGVLLHPARYKSCCWGRLFTRNKIMMLWQYFCTSSCPIQILLLFQDFYSLLFVVRILLLRPDFYSLLASSRLPLRRLSRIGFDDEVNLFLPTSSPWIDLCHGSIYKNSYCFGFINWNSRLRTHIVMVSSTETPASGLIFPRTVGR